MIITFGTFVSRPNSSRKDKVIIYHSTSFSMFQITRLFNKNLEQGMEASVWGKSSIWTGKYAGVGGNFCLKTSLARGFLVVN